MMPDDNPTPPAVEPTGETPPALIDAAALAARIWSGGNYAPPAPTAQAAAPSDDPSAVAARIWAGC